MKATDLRFFLVLKLKHRDWFLSGDDRCFAYFFVLRLLIFSVYGYTVPTFCQLDGQSVEWNFVHGLLRQCGFVSCTNVKKLTLNNITGQLHNLSSFSD